MGFAVSCVHMVWLGVVAHPQGVEAIVVRRAPNAFDKLDVGKVEEVSRLTPAAGAYALVRLVLELYRGEPLVVDPPMMLNTLRPSQNIRG